MSEQFTPYVPADKKIPEFTFTAIFIGVVLAIVFGAANAYLGLRLGSTVSASIPASVISMCILRILLKRDSVLENNIVQSIASAGEAIAAGSIFTVPAIFFWAKEGNMQMPSLLLLTLLSLIGGILGVFFMQPLRHTLIVKEHGILPYPEGTACADVLLAGESSNTDGAKLLFRGISLAFVTKFLTDAFKLIPSRLSLSLKSLRTEISLDISSAFIGVGYIVGPKVASYQFAGAILSWFVLIPIITLFGADTLLYPGNEVISKIYASGGAQAIWSHYIRYIGTGAVATAGIISLIKNIPTILDAFKKTFVGLKDDEKVAQIKRTDEMVNMKYLTTIVILFVLLMAFMPQFNLGFLGTLLVLLFGFFFTCVSSRMVGLIGSSNNPASSMTIATLILATGLLKFCGRTDATGLKAAICLGVIVCTTICISADISQDLKTGYIVGATPKYQVYGEIIGVVSTSIFIGCIMLLLDKAWGLGSQTLAAPQATMIKMVLEGLIKGDLPWGLIFIGAFMVCTVEVLNVPVLPFALGMYLPFSLSAAFAIGGFTRFVAEKLHKQKTSGENDKAILFCSGLIAGEGLLGILLAVFEISGINSILNVSDKINMGNLGGIALIVLIILSVYKAKKD